MTGFPVLKILRKLPGNAHHTAKLMCSSKIWTFQGFGGRWLVLEWQNHKVWSSLPSPLRPIVFFQMIFFFPNRDSILTHRSLGFQFNVVKLHMYVFFIKLSFHKSVFCCNGYQFMPFRVSTALAYYLRWTLKDENTVIFHHEIDPFLVLITTMLTRFCICKEREFKKTPCEYHKQNRNYASFCNFYRTPKCLGCRWNWRETIAVNFPIKAIGKKPEKGRAATGFESVTSANTGAMLYQLSYEATHWKRGQFIEFISSRAVKWSEVYTK